MINFRIGDRVRLSDPHIFKKNKVIGTVVNVRYEAIDVQWDRVPGASHDYLPSDIELDNRPDEDDTIGNGKEVA